MNRKDFFKTLIGIGIGSQLDLKPKEILEAKKIVPTVLDGVSIYGGCQTACSFPLTGFDDRNSPFRKL